MRATLILRLGVVILALQACTSESDRDAGVVTRARAGDVADDSWPTYNRTLDGQRFSPLAEITTANAARLKPVCEMSMGEEGGFQTGPVVVGETMFLTTAHTTVAMNAAT